VVVRITAVVVVLLLLGACGGDGGSQEASETPTGEAAAKPSGGAPAATFAAPKSGAKVSSPVAVKMKASKIKIVEAGPVKKGTGHFHVMIDTKCVAKGKPIPEDASHVHYGDASKTAKLKLDPGKHTLCLQLGNGAHKAIGKTDTVKITVSK
jgi:pyruvate/2-oxoglutarate dehydrogenase complex dihydrolipoamide acyltransferase (E2) component